MSELITQIASDAVIDKAYDWLCKQRKNFSHNNDVWTLRRCWQTIKPNLQQKLRQGKYCFSPQTEIRLPEEKLESWCAIDSLVLKAMAIVIGNHLKPILSSRCFHIKGHGGAKKAVREVHNHLSPKSYVMKSDVKSYYASIDHMLLFDMLTGYVNDKYVLRLLWQYLNRTVCYGENYQEISRGISLGCPLSPLMAALFLKPLDDAMQDSGLFYVRFMDDWIVIAPTRWKLRKAVAKVNTILEGLLLEKHPDKTFIGRAVRGFSFLGYFLTPWGVSVAQSTWKNMQKRISRLYEQDAGSIGQYVTRWLRWVIAGNIGVDVAVLQGQCAGLVSLVPAFH